MMIPKEYNIKDIHRNDIDTNIGNIPNKITLLNIRSPQDNFYRDSEKRLTSHAWPYYLNALGARGQALLKSYLMAPKLEPD